ncbi:MAG: ABC transporter ATP-binding protein [Actinomycetota bacterium]
MIELAGVTFAYGTSERPVLADIDITVEAGEFVLVCGRSGCGKSTLLKLINGIIPGSEEGELTGRVTVAGVEPKDVRLQELSASVGSVFQHPRTQLFTLNTTDELLFGSSNHRIPAPEMLDRLRVNVDAFGLEPLLDRSIFELSGGEAQKIACASAAMLQPPIFVLDEPSASLDATGIDELREVLAVLKRSGATILVAEHRLHYLTELCDRVLYLEAGRLDAVLDRETFVSLDEERRSTMGLRALERVEVRQRSQPEAGPAPTTAPPGPGSLTIERLRVHRKRQLVVDVAHLELPTDQVIALTGPNGAGKSSFAAGFSGILRADASILAGGQALSKRERLRRTFVVMQDVNHQLFAESVLDEVTLGHDLDDEAVRAEAEAVLRSLGLEQFLDDHPYGLSGGQKQRLAIASALLAGKRYLIFDEPTSGIDRDHMERFGRQVQAIKDEVDLVLVITHDTEFIETCADAVVELERGRVVARHQLRR